MRKIIALLPILSLMLLSGCIWNWLDPVNDEELEAVDLGLPSGVKWASKNLGAKNPEDLGTNSTWPSNPTEDSILNMDDDIVSSRLGPEWRMPTQWEFRELLMCCKWEPTQRNGKQGYKVTSKINSNSLFIPVVTQRLLFSDEVTETFYWTSCAADDDKAVALSVLEQSLIEKTRSNNMYFRPVMAGREEPKDFSLSGCPPKVPAGSVFYPEVSYFPSDAINKSLVWKSNDEQIAVIDKEGFIYALSPGRVEIQVTSPVLGKTEFYILTVADYCVPKMIDLGLPSGTLWASHDLGAIDDNTAGLGFAWGEVRPKLYFTQSEYNGSRCSYTDGTNYLKQEDDAATVILGKEWRIPSPADYSELAENCNITYTQEEGRKGFVLTSKINGNSIFFPSQAISPKFWTSQMYYDDHRKSQAVKIYNNINSFSIYSFSDFRYEGKRIRPVYGGTRPASDFSVTNPEFTMYIGETAPAPIVYRQIVPGASRSVEWKSSSPDIVSVDDEGNLTARYFGEATILAYVRSSGCSARCHVTVPGHRGMVPIDLGLPSRTKWASCNLGAQTDKDLGYFLSFGEAQPKDDYSQETYTGWHEDPVTAILGKHWRMPSAWEMAELFSVNGRTYRRTRGDATGNGEIPSWWLCDKSSAFIFVLPAGGYMDGKENIQSANAYYWCTNEGSPWYFHDIPYTDDPYAAGPDEPRPSDSPHLGMLVRPVWVD